MALPDVLEALEINEAKIEAKARFLFIGGLLLLIAVAFLGGYHLFEISIRSTL